MQNVGRGRLRGGGSTPAEFAAHVRRNTTSGAASQTAGLRANYEARRAPLQRAATGVSRADQGTAAAPHFLFDFRSFPPKPLDLPPCRTDNSFVAGAVAPRFAPMAAPKRPTSLRATRRQEGSM